MTIPEMAAYLNLARSTLRMQIRLGALKAEKRGRDWFVTRAEVERYKRESVGQRGRKRKN